MTFAFPALGSRSVKEVSAREVLAVLKEVERRGAYETARKLRTSIVDVFRFAIATARTDNDPTVALHGALVAPTIKLRAAIVAAKAFGGLLRTVEDYDGRWKRDKPSNGSPCLSSALASYARRKGRNSTPPFGRPRRPNEDS